MTSRLIIALLFGLIFFTCSKPNKEKLEEKNPEAYHPETTQIEVKQPIVIDTAELHLEADLMYGNDRYDEALGLYNNLLTVDSLNGKYNYRKGFCLVRLNRHSESIKCYLKSIDLNYKTFDSYKSLGIIYYFALNDNHLAKKYFEKCLEIDPVSVEIKKYLEALSGDKGKNNI